MSGIQRILHPTDFSQPAAQAFHIACGIARDRAAKVILIHVAQRPVTSVAGMSVPPPPTIARESLKAQLDSIAASSPGIEVECRLVEGEPVSTILDLARESMADVIVIGSHGRTGLSRLLLGSIAEQVVRRAACPVLTVKSPANETASSKTSAAS